VSFSVLLLVLPAALLLAIELFVGLAGRLPAVWARSACTIAVRDPVSAGMMGVYRKSNRRSRRS
jgi:hypothetical protein